MKLARAMRLPFLLLRLVMRALLSPGNELTGRRRPPEKLLASPLAAAHSSGA